MLSWRLNRTEAAPISKAQKRGFAIQWPPGCKRKRPCQAQVRGGQGHLPALKAFHAHGEGIADIPDEQPLGQVAWDAYSASVNRHLSGKGIERRMPAWDRLDKRSRRCWQAGAYAAAVRAWLEAPDSLSLTHTVPTAAMRPADAEPQSVSKPTMHKGLPVLSLQGWNGGGV